MHKSYFYGSPDSFIQVVAHKQKYHDKLIALGFVDSADKLGGEVIEGESSNPSPEGVITSISDLVNLIDSSTSKDDIEAIVLDAKGIDIDKRGGLDAVKRKAIAALTGESDEG